MRMIPPEYLCGYLYFGNGDMRLRIKDRSYIMVRDKWLN